MPRVLFWIRHPPYSTNHLSEAIRVSTMATALDVEVELAFVGDGVWGLVAGQEPHRLGPPIETLLRDVAREDTPILVDRASLEARGISRERLASHLAMRLVSSPELAQHVLRADRVVPM